MADRYLRASGNWNGAVWAATSGGAAGSAATPTANDVVYMSANFTVTLTANATCLGVMHSAGTLNLSGYQLTTQMINCYGSGTIDISKSRLILNNSSTWYQGPLNFVSGSFTLNAASSYIEVNATDSSDIYLRTLSKTFGDVWINLGVASGVSNTAYVTGSPTFRSLIIQSKNSEAHTVNFDDDVYVSKFIAIGSSTSNRLTINNPERCLIFDDTGSSYGQNLNMQWQPASNIFYDPPIFPIYIGSNSIGQNNGWTYQDPPKISTLVDPLTTAPASNPNWVISGTIGQVSTGLGGGGYKLTKDGHYIISTDRYDLVDSELIIEMSSTQLLYEYFPGIYLYNGDLSFGPINFLTYEGGGYQSLNYGYAAILEETEAQANLYKHRGGVPSAHDNIASISYSGDVDSILNKSFFFKFYLDSVSSEVQSSIFFEGSWTQGTPVSIPPDTINMYRSVRLMTNMYAYTGSLEGDRIIGSINMLPEPQNSGAFFQMF